MSLESSLMFSDVCDGFRPDWKLLRDCHWMILSAHRRVPL